MAARFWIGGGTNTNWNASPTTNWCATSGGAVRVAAPTVSDDVTFDGAGGGNSASIISATISCLSLTITSGFTNTITHNAVLTIAGNVTFVTGYTIAGTSGITISAASTITSGGKTWPNAVIFSGANTKTLSGDWTITGSLTVSGVTTVTSNTLNIGAGLTVNAVCSGTTSIVLNGTGTVNLVNALKNNLTINTAGTITFAASTNSYDTGVLTWTAGTVVTTGSTLQIQASTTLSTNGITWNNITLTVTSTITINSLLSVSGTFTINAASSITFAGTAGFTVATFSCLSVSAVTQTLVNTVTYTITAAFNCFMSRVSTIVLFTSDHATNKAILTLNNGATCNVLASFTRIDASNGRAIWTFNGVVTTCFNIISLTDLSFVTGKATVIQGFSNY